MVYHAVAVAISGLPGRNFLFSSSDFCIRPSGTAGSPRKILLHWRRGFHSGKANYYIVVGSLLGLYGDNGKENGNLNPKP